MTADGDEPGLELAVFVRDTMAVYSLPERGEVVIGRGAGSDVCLDHPSISRRHARLHLGPPLQIEDLGSANGTRSGTPLRRLAGTLGTVTLGEPIRVGSVTIAVRRPSRPIATVSSNSSVSTDVPIEALVPPGGSDVVLCDPAMVALYEQVRLAARSSLSVLVLGETGVGKDVIARAVHKGSPRAEKPFSALNCAAFAETLLESELFGHEKGAFTGAVRAQPGLFEAAAGGTVLLDEIGEMPASVQAKLLRVIEDRQVLRVGSRTPRFVDVRFVAATNRDLERDAAKGTFRQDLYFRVAGLTVTVPPLRARPSEILPLALTFARKAAAELGSAAPPSLSPEAQAALARHRWPGNVRELRNVIERAVVLCGGNTLRLSHLPASLAGPAALPTFADDGASTERDRIVAALQASAGNQSEAARRLGISRRTLVSRLSRYELPRPHAPK